MRTRAEKSELVKYIIECPTDLAGEDEEVVHRLIQETVSRNTTQSEDKKLSPGEVLAGRMAAYVGSWNFIFIFAAILVLWIGANTVFLLRPYDPYPYILLNLILSCIAGIQAPLIMMSQNRQEKEDRLRAQNDYKINLKAELIVEDTHLKMDELLEFQRKLDQRLAQLEARLSEQWLSPLLDSRTLGPDGAPDSDPQE